MQYFKYNIFILFQMRLSIDNFQTFNTNQSENPINSLRKYIKFD